MAGKGDLIAKTVDKQLAVSPYGANKIVSGVLATMVESLLESGSLTINGFGTWKVVTRAPRVARNPATGEVLQVPSKKTIKFTPSPQIKEQLNTA